MYSSRHLNGVSGRYETPEQIWIQIMDPNVCYNAWETIHLNHEKHSSHFTWNNCVCFTGVGFSRPSLLQSISVMYTCTWGVAGQQIARFSHLTFFCQKIYQRICFFKFCLFWGYMRTLLCSSWKYQKWYSSLKREKHLYTLLKLNS